MELYMRTYHVRLSDITWDDQWLPGGEEPVPFEEVSLPLSYETEIQAFTAREAVWMAEEQVAEIHGYAPDKCFFNTKLIDTPPTTCGWAYMDGAIDWWEDGNPL